MVVLVEFYCGIETLVEEGDFLFNGRAKSGALGRIHELKYGWRNECVQDAMIMRRLSVLLTAIGRRLGGVFELSFGKKNMLTKLKERLARRRKLAAREA